MALWCANGAVMPKVLQTFPDLERHTQEVTLDGTPYQVRLTWRQRPRAWYMDLLAADGAPIALGRRLSPRSLPLFGSAVANAPPGNLIVRGPARYTRQALGESLLIIYYAADELQFAEPERAFEVQ